MTKWNYVLDEGKALREAIDNEDRDAVLDNLTICWKKVHELVPDCYIESELNNDLMTIDMLKEDIENGDDANTEDEINEMLDDFYMYCDLARIFIPL